MDSAKIIFAERLKETLAVRGISQARFAEMVRTTPQAISSYTKAKTSPDFDMLCIIAEELGVTTDFLLGLSHASTVEETPIIEELERKGNFDTYLLTTFRKFVLIRNKMRNLYSGHHSGTNDNSLVLQFLYEIDAVCKKYGAVSEAFGYNLKFAPEHAGEFDAFGSDFMDKLNLLLQNAEFHMENTEPAIISELIRMEHDLK